MIGVSNAIGFYLRAIASPVNSAHFCTFRAIREKLGASPRSWIPIGDPISYIMYGSIVCLLGYRQKLLYSKDKVIMILKYIFNFELFFTFYPLRIKLFLINFLKLDHKTIFDELQWNNVKKKTMKKQMKHYLANWIIGFYNVFV